jgi:hypothetical protein
MTYLVIITIIEPAGLKAAQLQIPENFHENFEM